MVFAIIYCCGHLFHTDIHRPNVEGHTYFPLLLEGNEGGEKSLS